MTAYQWQAAAYTEELRGLLAEQENVEAIDGIFEADLVRRQSSRLAREGTDDEAPGEIIDLHSR